MKKIIIAITLLLFMTTQVMAGAYYEEARDDFTGEDNSYVAVLRSSGDEMGLGWNCSNIGFNIFLVHSYLSGDIYGFVTVRYKFDDGAPSSENKFILSAGKEYTYFSQNKIAAFTRKALSSNQVMIRIINPLDGKTLTTTFPLKGLNEELPKLKCIKSYFK